MEIFIKKLMTYEVEDIKEKLQKFFDRDYSQKDDNQSVLNESMFKLKQFGNDTGK